ncbi:enamelin [Rhineura floridana]|uniref:enamelin n=1 Tax=Rhineura floridana TaxID=261503 RepID=UPI002AC84723|nr:enamelin [Rhineura floridana]
MKLILLYLCLMGTSCAMSLRKPRKAGFGSKSEEMMQFGPYGYMNSPQLAHWATSLYDFHSSFPQMFPQQSILPQQRFYLWQQQTPVHQAAKLPQHEPHQTPASKQPNSGPQPRPQLLPQQPRHQQPQPKIQPPPKQPQSTNPSQAHQQVPVQQPKGGKQQQPPAFPPHQQQPWHFPQIFGHRGFQPQAFGPYQGHMPYGQPPISNEEGTPYFGYGYHGMGGRPPYYSEEMFEQDFEKPKEKEAPKESPAPDPATNSTVSGTNSTISNPASQGGNGTISGLGTTGNGASSPGLDSKLLHGSGVPTPSPTVHVSAGNGAAQNVIDPSSHRPLSPNVNAIQSFPSGGQQSPGHGSHIYKSHPDMGDTRHNALISRGNPSTQTEDPTYPMGYGENSNHKGNLQSTNSNYPPINSRSNLYGQQEQPHYPGRNPSGQRERLSFPSSHPQGQGNKDPVYRDNNLNHLLPEGNSLDPQFNTIGRTGDVYNARENADRFQHSGVHRSSTLSHQGVFSATSRTPFEIETQQYDWKGQSFNHPDHERERFPPSQNHMWNNQEDSQVFQEAPPRYNSMYSSGSSRQRGHATYSENNHYGQRTPSYYPRAREDRENSPTMGPVDQREDPSYPPDLPSNQMQRNTYLRNVQQELPPYPRQKPWTQEKHLHDIDRQYRNPPYNPTQHDIYSTDNPDNQRSYFPYEEINQWTPEEHSPIHGAEHLSQSEKSPYGMNNVYGYRERNLQNQGPNSHLQSTTLLQSRPQYPERDTWAPQMVGPSAQKENSPYFNTHSTDLRRNPMHAEDREGAMHGSALISSINVAEKNHFLDTVGYPDDYPREHRTITSQPTASHLCCEDDSPVPRENLLAPLRSAPHFQFASWEQKGSLAYPEGNHAKHARHAPYPTGIQSNHRDKSLKPGKTTSHQRENLGAFGEDVAALKKNLPCSKSQLSQQNEHEANYETGLPAPRNAPCYGSSIRGDEHSGWIVGGNQPKRESEREASIKLVPENVPSPLGIRSDPGGEDVRTEEQEALGFKRIPCFGSWLKQYLASTGAPSGDQQHHLFHAENPSSTGRPNIMPSEPQPITSTNPSLDVEEPPFKFSSPGELAEQANEGMPDCLLLQSK